MKKRFGTFTCLCLVLTVLLAPRAFAAEIVDSGYCGGEGDGTNLTWTLDDEGTLTISGEGEMADYAFEEDDRVVDVIIGEGVTTIGENAFDYCCSLTRIIIPDSVTFIGEWTFADCSSLTQITLPNSITSINDFTFDGCTSLAQITIPDNVTHIGAYAFGECASLTQITLSEKILSINQDAFSECSSLKAITVAENNPVYAAVDGVLYTKDMSTLICYPAGRIESSFTLPGNVRDISFDVFSTCPSLTDFIVAEDNQWYTAVDGMLYDKNLTTLLCCPKGRQDIGIVPSSVTTIGSHAFEECDYLTQITLPYGITSIAYYAFHDCDSLTRVVLPDSVASIAPFAFQNCESLNEINIPDSVTAIESCVFDKCESLLQITIPKSVTYIGEVVFSGCTSLMQITVDEENPFYASTDGVLYNRDRTTLIWYPIGKEDHSFVIPNSVTSIAANVFEDSQTLTQIEFPNSVTSIGEWAFNDCDALEQITIPASTATIGERAFAACDNLIALNITGNVFSIGDKAFARCHQLTKITFNGDAPNEVSAWAFDNTTATAYYPADNPTWTEDKLQDYGGDITWVPYTKDMVYHTRFSMDTIPQDEFDLDITVAHLGDSANDVAMISLYSSEGKYLETVLWQLTDDAVQTYTLSRNNTDGKIGRIRVFILDGLADPMPLAEAAEITSGT